MVSHHQELWQVVESYRLRTMRLIRRPAKRNKRSASRGLSSGAATSCATTRIFPETQERLQRKFCRYAGGNGPGRWLLL